GAAEEFKRGAAAGGDMRDFAGDAGLMDGGDGIATADNGSCARGGGGRDGFCDFEGAFGEGGHFEDTHGAVPDDGFASGDFCGVGGDCFWTDVEAHLIGRSGGDVDGFGASVGFEFGCDDVIDGQEQFEIALLGVG